MKALEMFLDWCCWTWKMGLRQRWNHDRLGFALTVSERRQKMLLTRDYIAQKEINDMRRIIMHARMRVETSKAVGGSAVISTTRHAAKIGLDNETALVILQDLYFSQLR